MEYLEDYMNDNDEELHIDEDFDEFLLDGDFNPVDEYYCE